MYVHVCIYIYMYILYSHSEIKILDGYGITGNLLNWLANIISIRLSATSS